MTIPGQVKQRILEIAHEAREKYCGVGVPRYQTRGPTGACIISARRISNALYESGVPHVWVKGWFNHGKETVGTRMRKNAHEWIAFPQYDNAILDVTADQFGDFPSVWFPADKNKYVEQKRTSMVEVYEHPALTFTPSGRWSKILRRPVIVRQYRRRR